MFTHIAVVRDLVDTQYKEYQEVRIHNQSSGVFCNSWLFKDFISPDIFLPVYGYVADDEFDYSGYQLLWPLIIR